MAAIDRLLEIMARLRDPEGGCPWDVKQSFETIAPYTIEEAYEVEEAIKRGDMDALRDELGDLLLQVVFHAQMAAEAGLFDFEDVAGAIADKMIRRHPHVFGEETVADAETQSRAWEEHKARERDAAADGDAETGALDGVPRALPALMRAQKLGKRAARVGFDWGDAEAVTAKVTEELDEVRAARRLDASARDHEIGDLLFACAQLARHLRVDPESALRQANRRFERRFGDMERTLAAEGRRPGEADADELEALWDAAKRRERTAS